ncbi:MAG: ribosome biogenesis GTPase YlqF [SAR324 cluster bacterium]|nr:ribosome biogenesis GTPase YlqF [SAR324 cluster bacterium]MBL7034956.1 ribosome biogenesis GTPase YlqF [SAR324 cluster bacterium]
MRIKYGVIEAPELLGKSWDTPDINWYPGHMLKAKKALAKQLKRVDVVLEMRDARIPLSSVNLDFEEMLQQKKRILLFNKTGLADVEITRKWVAYFQKKTTPFLFVDAMNKRELQNILPLSRKLMQEKWANFNRRGIRPPSLKLLITGIPNVGKSSLINRLSKRKAAETGPNPGVTKHQDWIKLGKDVELLDTPGILWPKIENREAGLRLTITGAIKDSVVGTSMLSDYLLEILLQKAPEQLLQHYQLAREDLGLLPGDLLEKIAKKRGCLKGGGEIDHPRAESLLLRDFRAGRLGRLSFDIPETAE